MDKEILIIDPDVSTALRVKEVISGYKIISRSRLSSGIKAVRPEGQIVLINSVLPDGSGIEGLKEIRTYYPEAVIIIFQEGAKEASIKTLKAGAYACVEKPINEEFLKIILNRAFRHLGLKEKLQGIKTAGERGHAIVLKSPEMLKVMRRIEKVSQKNAPIVLSGEDGTGRELIARTIHKKGHRKAGPFITLKAGDSLLQIDDNIKNAERGTLFIKGFEDLDEESRKKILMLAREGRFIPSESKEALKANVMVIVAVKDSTGLDWTEIKVPPLRNRRQDILPLAKHFLKESQEIFETSQKRLSRELEGFLLGYDWTGNVKELKNAIRKACILSKGEIIGKHDLLSEGIGSIKEFLESKLNRYLYEIAGVNKSNLYDTVVLEVQKSLIEIALKKTNGNQLQAAKLLDISRNTLSSKIKGLRTPT